MKKTIFLMLLLGLSFTISLQATNAPTNPVKATTEVVKEKTIALRLFNLQKFTTKIELTDLYGEANYYKTTVRDHNGFAKKLNLKKLQDGNYLMKITQNGETIQQVIRIRGNKIMFSKFS